MCYVYVSVRKGGGTQVKFLAWAGGCAKGLEAKFHCLWHRPKRDEEEGKREEEEGAKVSYGRTDECLLCTPRPCGGDRGRDVTRGAAAPKNIMITVPLGHTTV